LRDAAKQQTQANLATSLEMVRTGGDLRVPPGGRGRHPFTERFPSATLCTLIWIWIVVVCDRCHRSKRWLSAPDVPNLSFTAGRKYTAEVQRGKHIQ